MFKKTVQKQENEDACFSLMSIRMLMKVPGMPRKPSRHLIWKIATVDETGKALSPREWNNRRSKSMQVKKIMMGGCKDDETRPEVMEEGKDEISFCFEPGESVSQRKDLT